LKAREAMEVGYCGYCTRRFLFEPSQTLTVPSPPPEANVPEGIRGKERRESTKERVEGEGVHGVRHVALAVAFEGVVSTQIAPAASIIDIEIFNCHPTLSRSESRGCKEGRPRLSR
jgi:hypothetical protein